MKKIISEQRDFIQSLLLPKVERLMTASGPWLERMEIFAYGRDYRVTYRCQKNGVKTITFWPLGKGGGAP